MADQCSPVPAPGRTCWADEFSEFLCRPDKSAPTSGSVNPRGYRESPAICALLQEAEGAILLFLFTILFSGGSCTTAQSSFNAFTEAPCSTRPFYVTRTGGSTYVFQFSSAASAVCSSTVFGRAQHTLSYAPKYRVRLSFFYRVSFTPFSFTPGIFTGKRGNVTYLLLF